jgi:hypothetical protein
MAMPCVSAFAFMFELGGDEWTLSVPAGHEVEIASRERGWICQNIEEDTMLAVPVFDPVGVSHFKFDFF